MSSVWRPIRPRLRCKPAAPDFFNCEFSYSMQMPNKIGPCIRRLQRYTRSYRILWICKPHYLLDDAEHGGAFKFIRQLWGQKLSLLQTTWGTFPILPNSNDKTKFSIAPLLHGSSIATAQSAKYYFFLQ